MEKTQKTRKREILFFFFSFVLPALFPLKELLLEESWRAFASPVDSLESSSALSHLFKRAMTHQRDSESLVCLFTPKLLLGSGVALSLYTAGTPGSP